MGGLSRVVLRRWGRHRTLAAGGLLLGLVVLAAVAASWCAPHHPLAAGPALAPPSPAHWLGTDEMGRDVFSRVLYGARLSLLVGGISTGVALAVGLLLGLAAGYGGGVLETLIMRGIDILLAFPSFLLAIVVVALLGPSLPNAMLAIGVVGIPTYTRLVRGAVLAEKGRDYVAASRAVGAGPGRVVFRGILPNCLAPLIVQSTLFFATAVLDAAGLSFLGLGAQPPTVEWGLMLKSAKDVMLRAWWVITFPGLAILVTVIGLNLLGDALRDLLDPRLRGTAARRGSLGGS